MIKNRMKFYDCKTRDIGTDDYGQPLKTYTFLKKVEVSISLLTKVINELDPRYLKSTHLGLTYDKSLIEGMKLSDLATSYIIKVVNVDGRLNQLTLEVLQ